MAKFSLLSLCFLLVLHGSVAEFQLSVGRDPYHQHPPQPRYRDRNECRLENLNALEPAYRVKSEGGEIEYWDRNNEQLKCAGVAFRRVVIEPKGLFLPEYINGHRASYVVKGRGLEGVAIPGCPETYQSFQQQSQQSESQERYGDQHQKVRRLDRGDILAIPNGVPQWVYNNGDDQLVIVTLIDISNDDNQLDGNLREFFLAGNPQRSQQSRSQAQQEQFSQGNIFSQFRSKLLAESFQIKEETANKLKGEKDNRGPIIKVKEGLQVIMPPTQQREEEEQQQRQDKANFLDENLCNMRLKVNIEDPRHAESYNPRGGRVSRFNGQDHPIFNYLQLNVVRGVLYKNAILSPHYDSSHSLIYITRGSAEVQIVGNFDKPVYNGELREGQLLSVPQNFVVLKKAGNNGFEWVAFKTDDNVRVSSLAGSDSAIRGMPEEVLMNSYEISREEARNLKYNNNERMVFSPRSRSQGVASA